MRNIYGTGRRVVGWAFVVAAVAAVVLLVKGLYPADLPASRSPDFVDNVFDNRGVLWAARLLLVSAAGVLAVGGVFIVVSIGIRMKNGEWLRRAGPFEISEGSLREAEGEAEYWRRVAQANDEHADKLREQIDRSEELLNDLQDL
ncbi:MAG TPA: hypothetical protein VNC16_11245 [Solirubrobacterales bacterium]|jgi:hypothetical protein|nr:hypothetical protein [Solirubrobacterales bacterium]